MMIHHALVLRICTFLLGLLVWTSPAFAQSDSLVSDSDIPDPMPMADMADLDSTQFLLLGSDTTNPNNSGRTDVIMVVSVNWTYGTVAILSVPRDLYVFIPGYGMQRINTAYGYGEIKEEGTGPALLMETIRYNLGLEIAHYARVDFNDFIQIIDAVGGVDIAVDCAIQDWRLREPELDPADEDNWEMFTLPVGVQHMEGDLALWYVRSRRTSSDFDRGVRQQAIMRALLRHLRDLGLLDQVADLWPQVTDIVDTDLTLADMLALAPVAIGLDTGRISSYVLSLDREVINGRAPDGAQILIPQHDALRTLIQNFLTPPTPYRLAGSLSSVQITNASGNPELGLVAADRLAWDGFVTTLADDAPDYTLQFTRIIDHTGRVKGGDVVALQSILRVADEAVTREPDTQRQYDYDVVLGSAYYPCTRNVLPPAPAQQAG